MATSLRGRCRTALLMAGLAGLAGCARHELPPSEMAYRFTYDRHAHLSGWTDATGRTVRLTYDALGRPSALWAPQTRVSLVHNAQGLLAAIREPGGSTALRYDALGRPTEATYRYSPARCVRYTYDPLGRVASMSIADPAGPDQQVVYEYNVLGDLRSIAAGGNRIEFSYDPTNRQVRRRLPNGVVSRLTYAEDGALVAVEHHSPTGAALAAYRLARDAHGRVVTLVEQVGQETQRSQCEWDARGNLVGLREGAHQLRLTYDGMGNRLTAEGAEGMIQYRYDPFGRVAQAGQATYRYDRTGRTTSAESDGRPMGLKWDSLGRLSEVTTGTNKTQYTFDAVGHLMGRVRAGQTTNYLPNPLDPSGSPLAEFDGRGSLSRTWLQAGSLLACRSTGGENTYYLEDALGAARLAVDQGGSVVGRADYSVFGERRRCDGPMPPFRRAGDWLDVDTGLTLIGGRPYLPSLGRYLAPALDQVDPRRPRTLNLYARAPVLAEFKAEVDRAVGGWQSSLPGAFVSGLPSSVARAWQATVGFYRPGNLAELARGGVEWGEPTPGTLADQAREAGGIGAQRLVQGILLQSVLYEFEVASGLLPRTYLALGAAAPRAAGVGHIGIGERAAYGALHLGLVQTPRALLHFYPSRLYISAGPVVLRNVPYAPLLVAAMKQPTSSVEAPAQPTDTLADPFRPDGPLGSPLRQVERELGGVEVSADPAAIGQIGRITGLVVDRERDRVVLVGDGDLTLPPLRTEDLRTASRLVQAGHHEVAFTLDPADPTNPSGPWLAPKWIPEENLKGTHAGHVMFDQDYQLKQYAMGVQVSADGKMTRRECKVPGFKSLFDLSFADWGGAPQSCSRFWTELRGASIRRSGNTVVVENVETRVLTEQMHAGASGLVSSGGQVDPHAEAFVRFIQAHYADFERECPAMGELREWAKVMALASWLADQGLSLDPGPAAPPGDGKYVSKVPALSWTETREFPDSRRTITLIGGNVIEPKTLERADDGRAAALDRNVRAASSAAVDQAALTLDGAGGHRSAVVLPVTEGGRRLYAKQRQARTVRRGNVTYTLDARHRVRQASSGKGATLTFQRGSNGQLVALSGGRPDGSRIAVRASKTGDRASIRELGGAELKLAWSTGGRLASVSVGDQPLVSCTYDAAQRSTTMVWPDHRELITCDSAGLLLGRRIEPLASTTGGTRDAVTVARASRGGALSVQGQDGPLLVAEAGAEGAPSLTLAGQTITGGPAVQRCGDAVTAYTQAADGSARLDVRRGEATAGAYMVDGQWRQIVISTGEQWRREPSTQGELRLSSAIDGIALRSTYDSGGPLAKIDVEGGPNLTLINAQVAPGIMRPTDLRLMSPTTGQSRVPWPGWARLAQLFARGPA